MSTIKLRRSATAGKIPTTGQLELGEIAINTFDGKAYIKQDQDSTESIVEIGGGLAVQDSIKIDTFTGNGSNTQFTLSTEPIDEQYVFVTINGVSQHASEYTLSGSNIIFDEAVATSDAIEIRTNNPFVSSVSYRDYESYVYTGLSSASSVVGADSNSKTLQYTPGKVEVYDDGVKLVDGTHFTASNGTSITFSPAVSGTIEVISLSRASFADTSIHKSTDTVFTTTTADQVVDSFASGTYRTAKYLIQVTRGGEYTITELLLMHDGTDTYQTEYATLNSDVVLATFTSDINNGNVRLLTTPTYTNTDIKTQRITVTL